MSLEVSLAVLLAALLHAAWNGLLKGSSDILLKTAAIVAAAMLVTVPFIFIVPPPPRAAWPYLAGSLLTHVAYYFCMINAYRFGELSLAYPLMRGVAPLLTALLGIVLVRELPSGWAWAGIGLISSGVITLALKAEGMFDGHHGKAIGFALANAVVIAAYTIIDGVGVRTAGNSWSYIVWLFVLDGLPFTAWILATRRAAFVRFVAAQPFRSLAGGAFSAGAYAIAVWAMTKAPIAAVAALRETSVLFAALIGAKLLKERLTARRWIGVIAVVAGVVALKLG